MTNGVKVPCSTCRIHSLYSFLFSFLFTSYALQNSLLIFWFAAGFSWPLHQRPRALALLSDLFTVFSGNISLLNGCNFGPTRTSLQNSVNKFAVLFRMWLWRKVTILPFGHWRACCKLNILPHPQWLGIRFYLQPYLIGPYLIGSRSQKLYLFKFTRFLWSWELWAKKTHQLRDLDHIFFSHLSSFHFLWFQNVFQSIISHIFYLLLLMI